MILDEIKKKYPSLNTIAVDYEKDTLGYDKIIYLGTLLEKLRPYIELADMFLKTNHYKTAVWFTERELQEKYQILINTIKELEVL